MSDLQPGDVVVASHPLRDGIVRGIVDTDGRFYTTDQSVKGVSSSTFAPSNLRRLVVIDPEDREQVERLLAGYYTERDEWVAPRSVDKMQAALREFANPKPAKPEEPTGLGAVVRDAEGAKWIRTDCEGPAWSQWGNAIGRWNYERIDAVEVLSEGWSE